jgi:hypothetical protein
MPTNLPPMTAVKAWVAALGATLTALTAAVATAQVVLADGKLDFSEYGTIAVAAATLIGTIYGVWRAPNKVKRTPPASRENALR